MKRVSYIWACLLLCIGAYTTHAQTLDVPSSVNGDPGAFISVVSKTDCASVTWFVLDPGINLFPVSLLKDTKTAVVSGNTPGKYRLQAFSAKGDVVAGPVICVITINGNVPPQPKPVDPTPPGPKPVDPSVVAPIPVDGFRVLIVCETSETAKIPKEELAIMSSVKVSSYLNKKCVVGPDGRTKEFHIWDQNVKTDDETKLWQDVMKRKRDSLPWIVISDGKKGYEGPLPGTVDATLKLLQTYGGE